MRNISIFLLLVLLAGHSMAQDPFASTGGEVELRVNNNGSLGIDLSDLQPASSAKGTANHFLKQAGLWITATDASNRIRVASQLTLNQDQFDFWSGPLDTFTAKQGEGDWDKVWEISRAEIEQHRKNFTGQGYVVPQNISNWPAHSGKDLLKFLAPFVDNNVNGEYDPENGDYPSIKGDGAIYVIFNDNRSEHDVSKGMALGIEVHLLVYWYDNEPNRLFFDYLIINQSQDSYTDVRVGFFLWGQLGNDADNFMTTYGNDQAIGLYNGDKNDDGHFGAKFPYVLLKVVDQPLSNSMRIWPDQNAVSGFPTNDTGYYNYLHGRWLNGQRLQSSGNGQTQTKDADLIYLIEQGWTEESIPNEPGERCALAISSIGPMSGREYVRVSYAMECGLLDTSENVHLALKRQLNEMRTVLGVPETPSLNILVYPNPLNRTFNIEVEVPDNYIVSLYDIHGNLCLQRNLQINDQFRCNINLPSGIYLLEVKNETSCVRKTLVINE